MQFVMLLLVLAGLWAVRVALVRRTATAPLGRSGVAIFLLLHTSSAVWALRTGVRVRPWT